MSRRTDRVGAQLQGELARILREETTDPRIRLVTLTRIDVAPDLRSAIVFYSTLAGDGEDELAQLAEGLESAAPFLRRRAAAVMPTKRMPELRFRYDPSLSLGSKTLDLLRDLRESGGAAGDADVDPDADGREGAEHDETEPT